MDREGRAPVMPGCIAGINYVVWGADRTAGRSFEAVGSGRRGELEARVVRSLQGFAAALCPASTLCCYDWLGFTPCAASFLLSPPVSLLRAPSRRVSHTQESGSSWLGCMSRPAERRTCSAFPRRVYSSRTPSCEDKEELSGV